MTDGTEVAAVSKLEHECASRKGIGKHRMYPAHVSVDPDTVNSSSRLRSRLLPWRPPPLLIPSDDGDDAKVKNNHEHDTDSGHRDELAAVEREIAELAAARAQVLRELDMARQELASWDGARVAEAERDSVGSVGPGVGHPGVQGTPASLATSVCTPQRNARIVLLSDTLPQVETEARSGRAILGVEQGTLPPVTPDTWGAMVSARPDSAHLGFSEFDDVNESEARNEIEDAEPRWWPPPPCRHLRFFVGESEETLAVKGHELGVARATRAVLDPPPQQRRLCQQNAMDGESSDEEDDAEGVMKGAGPREQLQCSTSEGCPEGTGTEVARCAPVASDDEIALQREAPEQQQERERLEEQHMLRKLQREEENRRLEQLHELRRRLVITDEVEKLEELAHKQDVVYVHQQPPPPQMPPQQLQQPQQQQQPQCVMVKSRLDCKAELGQNSSVKQQGGQARSAALSVGLRNYRRAEQDGRRKTWESSSSSFNDGHPTACVGCHEQD